MANRQIAGLTAASGPDRTFVAPIQDAAAAAEAKKITLANLLALATAADISDASANGRSLITAANYAAMRTLLGLVIDTNVAANAFKTISVSGQSDVVADSATDTLTLAAGTGIAITTNAGTDTVTIAASGGSADDWDIVSTSNPSSPYTASTLTGNTLIKITALAGNLTINKPTGTFGSGKRFVVRYEITASGADRTLTMGTGISLGLGVQPPLVVASGTTSVYEFYTDDDGSTFKYDGDLDVSKIGTATAASGDFLLGMDASASNVLAKFAAPLAASDTVAGLAEAATTAETNTGTDAARYATPDGLAGSYAGTKAVSLPLAAAPGTDQATGDGASWFVVPACLNGMNLVGVVATVATAGTTGTSDYQIRRVRSGSAADMLSTKLTIDSTETSSTSAAAAAVIDAANDDVATGDLIYVDIDALSTTKPKGGAVGLEFRLP